ACTAAMSLRTMGGGGETISFMVCASNEAGKSFPFPQHFDNRRPFGSARNFDFAPGRAEASDKPLRFLLARKAAERARGFQRLPARRPHAESVLQQQWH